MTTSTSASTRPIRDPVGPGTRHRGRTGGGNGCPTTWPFDLDDLSRRSDMRPVRACRNQFFAGLALMLLTVPGPATAADPAGSLKVCASTKDAPYSTES